MAWNAGLRIKLARMWWDGKSAEEIAGKVGLRDADEVRRKVRAYNMQRGPNYNKTAAFKVKPAVAPKINPVTTYKHNKTTVPEPKPLKRDGKPVTLATARDGDCRWIHGEPSSSTPICAHPQVIGCYCQHHGERVHGGSAYAE